MVGTCRKCNELIIGRGDCQESDVSPRAVEVGLMFLQAVRDHWHTRHPSDSFDAQVAGGLAGLFPFLAGVEVGREKAAVLMVAMLALRERVFGIGYQGGALVPRPVKGAGAGGLWVGNLYQMPHPLVLEGRVQMLEELLKAGHLEPLWAGRLDEEKTRLRSLLDNEGDSHHAASVA